MFNYCTVEKGMLLLVYIFEKVTLAVWFQLSFYEALENRHIIGRLDIFGKVVLNFCTFVSNAFNTKSGLIYPRCL